MYYAKYCIPSRPSNPRPPYSKMTLNSIEANLCTSISAVITMTITIVVSLGEAVSLIWLWI